MLAKGDGLPSTADLRVILKTARCSEARFELVCSQKVVSLMQEYYAARAREYEAVYARPERRADIEWIRERLRLTFADLDVLEVACGTGFWTSSIASTATSVLATDGVQEPLAVARAKRLPGNVSFQELDAYSLASIGRAVTRAFAGLWPSHVPG